MENERKIVRAGDYKKSGSINCGCGSTYARLVCSTILKCPSII